MRQGLMLAAAGAIAMGSAAPALKVLAGSDLSAVHIIQARMVLGALTLAALALATRRNLRVPRRDWWLVGVYGAITLSLNQVIYTVALARLPVGITLLIEYLAPVLIALWIRIVRGKRLPRLLWGGIATTLAGLALISQVWTSVRLDGVGVLAALVAAATFAGRFLLAERGIRDHDPLVLTTWGAGVGAVVLLPLSPFPFDRVDGAEAGLLLWTGVVGMAVAVLLTAHAQRWITATAASLVSCVEIVVAAALAALLLGERLTPVQLFGAAVMLAGIATAQLGLASGAKAPEATALTNA